MMKEFQFIILLLSVVATAVFAQDATECPDEAADCSGVCEEAECAKFLTAECRANPCFGLCAPNFFWRGNNVTDDCDIERCSNRECPGSRLCVEDTVPPSCPEGNPLCRQHIRVRCILPPKPTDCSQITCGPGMFCRKKLRKKGVRCVQVTRCSQLECSKGYTCEEKEEGPVCVKSTPPSSCEEAACPEEMVCLILSVPGRDISVARCIEQAEADRMPVYSPDFSCSKFSCEESAPACTDVFEDGCFLTSVCNAVDCNTSDPATCPSNHVCINIPPEAVQMLQVPYTTSCSPPGFEYGGDCSTVNLCPLGLACHDVVFEGTIIGVGCGISAESYSGFTCAELGCPAPLECYETFIGGRGSLAMCAPEESVTLFAEELQ